MSASRPVTARRQVWPLGLSLLLLGAVLAAALAPALLPGDARMPRFAAGAIFAGSYLALAVGRIPGFQIDRAGIALVGAGLMVASGALPLAEAYRAIDLDTITLLLGMMIVVASLRLSGFFALATSWVGASARSPLILLGAVVATAGLLSAFLVNDAVCLVLAPLVLELTLALGRRPVPYLLAVAMASNVGSVATITGNPQNILIGGFSQIPYSAFALALGPVALVGLLVTGTLIALSHRAEFTDPTPMRAQRRKVTIHPALVVRSLVGTVCMIVLFFIGVLPARAAIVTGGLLLLTRRVKSRRIYAEIDWSLLLMFAGLFIIVAGAEHALLGPDLMAAIGRARLDRLPVLTLVTAAVSNLVSNVPAVLMLKPFIEALPNAGAAWLAVAMASTLAGNFTVLGSIANLIVVQRAGAAGVSIGFWDYFRVGAPLTAVTLAFGVWWLAR